MSTHEIRAILLAAGVGDRLRPFTDTTPKCLIPVGGRTLLERHLDILSTTPGIDSLVIVVGYLQEQIRAAVQAWQTRTGSAFPVLFEVNADYRKGSILSLHVAKDHLVRHDCIVMDADVIYPRVLMQRLVGSGHPNCFLLDERCTPTGEEMMVCVRDGRALHIARSREPSTLEGWDLSGEGVGFFKLHHAAAEALVETMDAMIGLGLDRVEYEAALDRFLKDHTAGCETVGDLPWTEIDFREDVDKAERLVLPRIEAIGG
jgi:choline kinase